MAEENKKQEAENLHVTPEEKETPKDQEGKQGEDTPAPKKEEDWEYTGDRTNVPDPFKKYAKGFDRYVSKKDQAIAEHREKAEKWDKLSSSEEYKRFQAVDKPPEIKLPGVTQEEADAIALGDKDTIDRVFQRGIDQRLEATLAPKEKALTERMASLDQKQKNQDTAEMVKSFAEVHPGFSEALNDEFLTEYMISAVEKGASLDQVWENVQKYQGTQVDKVNSSKEKELKEKLDGTTTGASINGDPDVVYVPDEREAQKLAIEFALKGDKRRVAVKRE